MSSNFKDEQDRRVNWEFLKYKIFRFSKRYVNEKAEKIKRKRVFLENKVLDSEKQRLTLLAYLTLLSLLLKGQRPN